MDKAFYSAPVEFVGRKVWARWDGRLVRIFDHRFQQITVHAKEEPGRFRTRPEPIPAEKINGIERGPVWWLRRVGSLGPHTKQWAEAMLEVRGIPGVRVLMGLHHLWQRHSTPVIEEACRIAQTHGAYRLRVIRKLIQHQGVPQKQFEFIQEHPIIRRLSDYGDLVRKAFQETCV